MPNFAAEYAAAPALPFMPAIDAMKTIAGAGRRRSSGSRRCVRSIGARRFRRSVASTLAIGALPVMAHAQEEVADMVRLAGALVLNIGTLSPHWIEAMLSAGAAANEAGVPVVLDPVGVGATSFRTDTAKRILDVVDVAVLRGNAGEVATLVGVESEVRGVESIAAGADAVTAPLLPDDRVATVLLDRYDAACTEDGTRTTST